MEQDAAELREAIEQYVQAVHQAYLDAGGGEHSRGLAAGPFTVVVAAARSLHLLATPEEIGVPEHGGGETHALSGLSWQLVFLDPSVMPELGEIPAGPEEPAGVQDAIGVDTVHYHLVVGQGSALTSHHAMHAGTGIAHREAQGTDS